MLIKRNELEIRDRQRSEQSIDRTAVARLADSIEQKGLFHAPVVWFDKATNTWVLLAGMRRTLAMDILRAEGRSFRFHGEPVDPDLLPAVSVTDLSAADIEEAELEENILREDPTWQDRSRALAKIHELRQAENPRQTYGQTAAELKEKGAKIATPQGASTSNSVLSTRIRQAVVISKHLDKPSVAKARNAEEALAIILKDESAKAEAELIKRRLKSAGENPDVQARHGDCLEILPRLDPEQFDLILCDPPYGIGADTGGFRQRTVHHHNYTDDTETAKTILTSILTEGFRLTKPRANLFMFGDIDLFPLFKTLSAQMGWTPFRTPIIWQKSLSEGLAPWGGQGFRRTYEVIFYATKGQKGLYQSPVDILSFKRVPRHERQYGPEKPVDLIRQLVECATLPGDYVLDPTCGAGSTLAACRQLRRRALGIEVNEDAYNLAVVAAQRDVVADDKREAELDSVA